MRLAWYVLGGEMLVEFMLHYICHISMTKHLYTLPASRSFCSSFTAFIQHVNSENANTVNDPLKSEILFRV